MANITNWLFKLRIWLIGPPSYFRVGDSVQLKDSDYLMVVREVINKRTMKRTLLYCEWYEPENKQTRQNLFPEEEVVPFDWYRAKEEKLTEKMAVDAFRETDDPSIETNESETIPAVRLDKA